MLNCESRKTPRLRHDDATGMLLPEIEIELTLNLLSWVLEPNNKNSHLLWFNCSECECIHELMSLMQDSRIFKDSSAAD